MSSTATDPNRDLEPHFHIYITLSEILVLRSYAACLAIKIDGWELMFDLCLVCSITNTLKQAL